MTPEPLAGKTVLLTRAATQTENLREQLQALGANCESLSMFDIAALGSKPSRPLSEYQGLIFTSRNAVIHGPSLSNDLPGCLAVGAGTAAELLTRGIKDVTYPADSRSEGLLSLAALSSIDQQRWLIVKGAGGRDHLRRELVNRGALVDSLVVYERRPTHIDTLRLEQAVSHSDYLMFFSGEGLQRLVEACPGTLRKHLFDTQLVVPSPRVVKMAQDIGFRHRACAASHMSDEALVAALVEANNCAESKNLDASENDKP